MATTVDLARIISVVQIHDVRLREAVCRSLSEPSIVADELAAKLSHEASVKTDPEDESNLLVSVRFSLEIRQETGAKELHAEIAAVFELSYVLPTEDSFSADEIEGFGQVIAVFNAWPYWREIVQSSLSRMGMPALTIPLYRLPQREVARAEADAQQVSCPQ